MKKLSAVFFSVVLIGLSSVPAYAQSKKARGFGDFDDGPRGFPGSNVEPLRREVVTLREELETAVKTIKQMQMVQAGAEAEAGPRYRGWTARMWLKQYEDLDPMYRLEAINAVGVLARKNKNLIPVLLASLKDESDAVGSAGARAVSGLGVDVTSALVDVLKDKTSVTSQIHAAYALGKMEPRSKAAVPALADALQENDWSLRKTAINALGAIGPDAKSAMPAMVKTFEQLLKITRDGNAIPRDKTLPLGKKKAGPVSSENEMAGIAMLKAMAKVDPKATVPALALALTEDDRKNLASTAMEMLGEMGPDAKAAFPVMVRAYANSLNEVKNETKSGFGVSVTRPLIFLRAIVKVDPACRTHFPRAVREATTPASTGPFGRGDRFESVTLEDFEEVLAILKKEREN